MYYPKNMTAVGAGAHEAGHIVEDWLIKKFRSVHSEYRPIPRRLVNEVYPNARFTAEGKGKSLKVLMAEIAMYASKNYSECFASAVSDYITNGANASLLSRLIWQRIKEELSKMMLPGEMMLAEFSLAEQEKYGILDEDGFVIGVKDDAPVEFKAAYEHDKKQDDERWAAGID